MAVYEHRPIVLQDTGVMPYIGQPGMASFVPASKRRLPRTRGNRGIFSDKLNKAVPPFGTQV